MNRLIIASFIALTFAGAFGTTMPRTSADEQEQKQIVFIVNPKSPLKEISKTGTLSEKELKDIFLGKTKFWGKSRIVTVNQKNKEIFEEFLEKYIGMTPAAYKEYWVKKVFAEGGNAPAVKENSADVIKVISETESGIGYVWDSDIKNDANGVEIISVTKETK